MRYIDFSSYIAPNQPSVDYSPPLAQALIDAEAQGARELYLGPGQFYFYTPTPPNRRVRLIGRTASDTIFNIKHTGNGLYFDGANDRMAGGAEDIGIMAAAGTGNVGLYLQGAQGASPDFTIFKNVIVTALPGSNWNYGLHISGVARSSPPGVRDVYLEHCEFFAALYYAVYIRSGVGIVFNGLGCYPAGGTSGKVLITDTSSQIHMNGAALNDIVTVDGGSTNVWQNGTKIA